MNQPSSRIEELALALEADFAANPALQGRQSAASLLETRCVRAPEAVERVVRNSFSFREFQSHSLYDQNGFFSAIGDYRDAMPLLPQMLAPFFGMFMAELSFATYLTNAPRGAAPTFLSLGAGPGILDRDLIDHINGSRFQLMSSFAPKESELFRNEAQYIISDVGDHSIPLLHQELADAQYSQGLRSRIHVRQLDAMDFTLPKSTYGIIYANELIDNLPTEPIISLRDGMYAVRVLARDSVGVLPKSAEHEMVLAETGVSSVLSPDVVRELIATGDTAAVRFAPVFVPIAADPIIYQDASMLRSVRNSNSNAFGTIYPLHLGLNGVFTSVRNSFAHGQIILIDYHSSEHGCHNWNVAVNHTEGASFGNHDIDFQIDPEQVIERGNRAGMRTLELTLLKDAMQPLLPLYNTFGAAEISRFAAVHRKPVEGAVGPMIEMVEFGQLMGQHYDVMVLGF